MGSQTVHDCSKAWPVFCRLLHAIVGKSLQNDRVSACELCGEVKAAPLAMLDRQRWLENEGEYLLIHIGCPKVAQSTSSAQNALPMMSKIFPDKPVVRCVNTVILKLLGS